MEDQTGRSEMTTTVDEEVRFRRYVKQLFPVSKCTWIKYAAAGSGQELFYCCKKWLQDFVRLGKATLCTVQRVRGIDCQYPLNDHHSLYLDRI